MAESLQQAIAANNARQTRNRRARELGIPKWLRRYSERYGRGIDAVAASQLQNADVPVLDHWRDRAAAAGETRPYPSARLSKAGDGFTLYDAPEDSE